MQHLQVPKIEIREIPQIPIISFPGGDIINDEMHALTNYLHLVNNSFFVNFVSKMNPLLHGVLEPFYNQVDAYYLNLETKCKDYSNNEIQTLLTKIQNNYLLRTKKVVNEMQNEILAEQTASMLKAIEYVTTEIEHLTDHLPTSIEIIYNIHDLAFNNNDTFSQKIFKAKKKIEFLSNGQPIKYQVKFRKIVSSYFPADGYEYFYEVLYKFGLVGVDFISNLQVLFNEIRKSLTIFENELESANFSLGLIAAERIKITDRFKDLLEKFQEEQQSLYNYAYSRVDDILRRIDVQLTKVNSNSIILKSATTRKKNIKANQNLQSAKAWLSKNPGLLYNAALLDILFLSFENKLRKIFADTTSEIEKTIKSNVIRTLVVFNTHLSVWIKEIQQNPASKFVPDKIDIHYNIEQFQGVYKDLLENALKNLKFTISRFPDSLDVMSDNSYNNLDKSQFNNIEVIHISVMRFLDYIIQDELIVPIQKLIARLPETLDKATRVVQDITNLIAFITQHPDEQSSVIGAEPVTINLPVFLKEQHQKITEQIEATKELYKSIVNETNLHLNTILEKMSLSHFQKMAKTFKQTERFWAKRKSLIKENIYLQKIFKLFKFQYDQLWYRQSEAILLSRKVKKTEEYSKALVNDMLNLLDELSIHSEIQKKIPFYYQQLFLRKQNYYNEFWVGRSSEIELAKKAIQRYHQGYTGGILITGEPGSGKTFFAKYLSSQVVSNSNIYFLQAPLGGSISTEVFTETLQRVIGLTLSIEAIFSKLAKDSIIIIDDIELWWEKSDNGLQVIDLIINLIDKYSKRCIFIVTANSVSFDLINRIKRIDNYFIGVVELEPFSAEELKNIVTIRQNVSGMHLKLHNKQKLKINSYDLANLFAKFFMFSKGNPGVTLFAWMANINACDEKSVTIKPPKLPDFSIFDNLEILDLIMLALFILHKRLDINRLERITLRPANFLVNKINYLKRSGLVIEDSKQIYELNPFFTMHIQNKLIQLEIL